MSKRSIAIDRLAIRLKGVSPEVARAAAGGLGRALLSRLAAAPPGSGRQRSGDIERVDSGAVQLASHTTPSELRTTIADRIATSIDATPE